MKPSVDFPVTVERMIAVDPATNQPRVKQVRVGEQVYFAVRTEPFASCKVIFTWPDDRQDQEPSILPSNDAATEGVIEWNWKVREGTEAPQTVNVEFQCTRADKRAENSAYDSFEVIP